MLEGFIEVTVADVTTAAYFDVMCLVFLTKKTQLLLAS